MEVVNTEKACTKGLTEEVNTEKALKLEAERELAELKAELFLSVVASGPEELAQMLCGMPNYAKVFPEVIAVRAGACDNDGWKRLPFSLVSNRRAVVVSMSVPTMGNKVSSPSFKALDCAVEWKLTVDYTLGGYLGNARNRRMHVCLTQTTPGYFHAGPGAPRMTINLLHTSSCETTSWKPLNLSWDLYYPLGRRSPMGSVCFHVSNDALYRRTHGGKLLFYIEMCVD